MQPVVASYWGKLRVSLHTILHFLYILRVLQMFLLFPLAGPKCCTHPQDYLDVSRPISPPGPRHDPNSPRSSMVAPKGGDLKFMFRIICKWYAPSFDSYFQRNVPWCDSHKCQRHLQCRLLVLLFIPKSSAIPQKYLSHTSKTLTAVLLLNSHDD